MSKIISLRAENVKRLCAVHINAEGQPVVTIAGMNGAGKSSVLDSIMYALGGKDACCAEPIRNGQDKAEVTIKTDSGLIVRRKWTRSESGQVRSTVEVTQDTANGKAKLQSPQGLLDSLCGSMAFDPLAFTRLKPRDQLEQLKELVGVSTDDIDAQIKAKFDERTDVNRRVKQLEGELAGCETFPDAPEREVSVAELTAKLNAVHAENRKADDADRVAGELRFAANRLASEIVALREQLDLMEKRHATAVDEAEEAEKLAASMGRVDPQPIMEAIAGADAINRKVRSNSTFRQLESKLDNAKAESDRLSKQIDRLRVDRQLMMEQAAWPVPGLGFGADGVMFNGLPFDQASSAEQLRVSAAMGFAMHPELRVLLIRDGSLLDDSSMAILAELAEANDGQLWIERVGDDETCSVVIEDGHVRAREPALV